MVAAAAAGGYCFYVRCCGSFFLCYSSGDGGDGGGGGGRGGGAGSGGVGGSDLASI